MLIQFKEKAPIRVQVIKGETLFVAKDVCAVLGIEKYRDAMTRVRPEERGSVQMDTPGGRQDFAAVNESGLYALVFQSRKPAAQDFRYWVTSEVLPSIRKYGKYVVPGSKEQLRLENNLKTKERRQFLKEISTHLTTTDKEEIARKYRRSLYTINMVLDGREMDTTLEFECVARANRNARLRRLLDDSEYRDRLLMDIHNV